MSSSSEEDEVFALAIALHNEEKKRKRQKRKYWVHKIWKHRLEEGEYHVLSGRIVDDEVKFYKYMRMTPRKFKDLLEIVSPYFTKRGTKLRSCIDVRERLTIFLRYLATGVDFQTLSFNFRVGHSTIHEIIHTTSEIIWKSLSQITLSQPSEELLKRSADQYEKLWDFPNCVGAIDGKHMHIQAPPNSGSLFFNYKKTFSIVLLALVDANYKFIAVDVGSYGKNSDGGIFADSKIGKSLENNTFNMPSDRPLTEGGDFIPYVIVGDEAFPAKKYLLRPFPGKYLSQEKRIFNYRLCRARRVVENTFGILCQKFRLFLNKMQVHPDKADMIILASLCLHNFLRGDDTFISSLQDENSETGTPMFDNFQHVGGRYSGDALNIRDKFMKYFCDEGQVPWQLDKINEGV